MKSGMDKLYNILKVCACFIAAIFNIIVYFKYTDTKLSFFILIFSLIMVGLCYYQQVFFYRYMKYNLEQLSEMLQTISDMQETEIFSTVEDSMFSKLQNQTIKLTKLLKNQNLKIEEDKNEIKSLISDIAHQLKTPLANMKMYSEFLKDESLSEEDRKEFNKVILVSLNKLEFLVESMIKMSRLESGVINLKPGRTNLNDTILLAIKQVFKKAEIRNINVEFEPVSNISFIYDSRWTTEAIFNILENAVKYSDENSIIKISVQEYEMFIRIDIKNKGIGITEEEMPKIFSRFYRGINSGKTEGIGIGLYLAREIITMQGGYIKVRSKEYKTIFSIFMPK
ncbi:MAG: HAMP domain-containing sensor histidine kinase [Clostridiaceae bacterium]|nr:HAMP domain-containing sensor histidine kinase [Clostridiaceae bacterium]